MFFLLILSHKFYVQDQVNRKLFSATLQVKVGEETWHSPYRQTQFV